MSNSQAIKSLEKQIEKLKLDQLNEQNFAGNKKDQSVQNLSDEKNKALSTEKNLEYDDMQNQEKSH